MISAVASGLCGPTTPGEVVISELEVVQCYEQHLNLQGMSKNEVWSFLCSHKRAFINYVSFSHQSLRKIKFLELVCFSSVTNRVPIVNCPIKINGQSYHFILVWKDNQVCSLKESISYLLPLSILCLNTNSWGSELLRRLRFGPWVCAWPCFCRWT